MSGLSQGFVVGFLSTWGVFKAGSFFHFVATKNCARWHIYNKTPQIKKEVVSLMFTGYNYAIFAEKKSFAYLLILLIFPPFLVAVPNQVFAQFAGGSGTSADPYQVATATQLDSVRHHLASYFIQTADINLNVSPYNTGTGWAPIGTDANPFTGQYDGGNYTISGLMIAAATHTNYVGLFGKTEANPYTNELKNVRLEGVNISGPNLQYVGALVGYNFNTSVVKSSAEGEINTTGSSGYVGGLVGYNYGGIETSYSKVDVVGDQNVGGLAGGSYSAVNKSYAIGKVTGRYQVGGLTGMAYNKTSNCFSISEITVVWNYGIDPTRIGGLIGNLMTSNSKVEYSYSASTFTFSEIGSFSYLGGLIGKSNGTTTNSYWDKTKANYLSSGGTAKTTAEMQTQSTYSGWDFSSNWKIQGEDNGGYPYLRSVTGGINLAPTASNVAFSGTVASLKTLTGTYTYADSDGDTEDGTTFQWYQADDSTGTNRSAISGATSSTYTLTHSDTTKYIAVGVTPKNANSTGSEVLSDYNGPVTVTFAGGSGSSADPYQISNADQMNNIRDYLTSSFIQVNDISMDVSPYNSGSGWEPIGDVTNSFEGTFDGGNYTIDGLFISRSSSGYVGLFGRVMGTNTNNIDLKNIHLTNVDITGGGSVGALSGDAYKLTVQNCSVTGVIKGASSNIGGLIGNLAGASSKNYAKVSVSGRSNLGGLFGSAGGDIDQSYAIGTVTSTSETIDNRYIGGLVGLTSRGISNSYALVEIILHGNTINSVGGLFGLVSTAAEVVENTYALGVIKFEDSSPSLLRVGGLAGYKERHARNSYWNSEVGYATSITGTGKTTAEMKLQTSYSTWNFSTIWAIDPTRNSGYPYLRNTSGGVSYAPVASNVTFSGTVALDDTLTGSYTYYSQDGLPQDSSSFQWYMAVDASGTNKTAIAGATAITYVPNDDSLWYKYLSLEVTVYDSLNSGLPVNSSFQGPIPGDFAGGYGTTEEPFQVSTFDQFLKMKNYLTSRFEMINDIDASGKGALFIGYNAANQFKGVFDGQGFTLSNYSGDAVFGYIGGGTIKDLRLTNLNISCSYYCGSVVRIMYGGTVTDIYAQGKITYSGTYGTGGLVGYQQGWVRNSYADFEINAPNAGGITGILQNGGISNSYATGSVTGSDPTGLSRSNGGTIENSYTTMKLNGSNAAGITTGGTVTNSYWNTDFSGETSASFSAVGEGKTTAEMMKQSTYANWDFNDDWGIVEGYSFPYLLSSEDRLMALEISGDEGWRLMSSPLSGVTYAELFDSLWTQGFTGADSENGTSSILRWNEATRSWAAPSSASDTVSRGEGLLVYVYADKDYDGQADAFPRRLLVKSERDTTDLSLSLSYTNTDSLAGDGWNLIGNPYETPINWDATNGWGKNNVDNTVYVWSDSANSGTGAYQTWNGITGTLQNGKIAPWQGFWVKTNKAAPSVSFSDSVKTTGGYFRKQAPISSIKFSLEANSLLNSAVVMFSEEAQIGKDGLDAYKLASYNSNFITLGTSLASLEIMDIQALPLSAFTEQTLNLFMDGSDLRGVNKLSWNVQLLPDDVEFILIDNKAGKAISLRDQDSYTFTVDERKAAKLSSGKVNPVSIPTVVSTSIEEENRFSLIIRNVTVSSEQETDLPENFGLSQNYPNPFNPTTVISYQLPENSLVDLRVFDMLGREVANLVSGQVEAGYHQVQFNARDLASGVYIYRLQAGKKVFTKKLTLIK